MRYATPAAKLVAKIPYAVTAIPTWIVSSGAFWRAGTSGLISDGRLDGVQQHREGDAGRDEPDRADRVAALEEEVAADHREREGDAELEHVAPRPAPDHDRPGQQRQRRGRRQAATVIQIAARESGVGEAAVAGAGVGRAGPGRSRTSRSRRPRRPAGWWRPARACVRRPLASITAWPTCAAKPIATSSTPTENRVEERTSSDISGLRRLGSGGRGAARLGAGRAGRRPRRRLHLEDEAAVRAGVDRRRRGRGRTSGR